MGNSNIEKMEGIDPQRDSPQGTENMSTKSEKTISATDPEAPAALEDKPADIPPDGGYGWVCVGCVFLINAHTWGVNSVSVNPFSLMTFILT